MTYSVSVSGTTFTVDMTSVSLSVALSQVGQQGATGPTGALQTDTVTGDLYVSGDVGIGTSSPAFELDVDGDIRSRSNVILTNGPFSRLKFTESTETNGYFIRANVSSVADFGLKIEKLDGTDIYDAGSTIAAHIWYSISGTERMRIDNSGNVGIGTTTPVRTLDIQTASGDADARIYARGTGSGDDAILYLGIAGTSATTRVSFGDSDDADVGRIIYGHNGDYMSFTTAASEAMRIESDGNVGVGVSSPNHRLDVNGSIGFNPGSSVTPVDNGDVTFELTNNTTLTIKAKGSDGVVRSGTVTLS